MAFSTEDTIVAVATPEGRGGIGVVRLSGQRAAEIASAMCDRTTPFAPRHATLVRVIDPSVATGTRTLDTAVVTYFPSPRSYTGDDVVEFSAHGSPVLLRQIVSAALARGARLAEPGEFTLRAYLNGRVDLVQAEAVADLVAAVTPLQARAAVDQLDGTLTAALAAIDQQLLDLSARLEASLDFPDEGFHFITPTDTAQALAGIEDELRALGARGRHGRLIREGRTVVITGPANAGKSSLFNALVGTDRAIVAPLPGTTRDLITECVDVEGVPITFVDTAGVRAASDEVEAEGIARAERARDAAAVSLVVLDATVGLGEFERRVLEDAPLPKVVALNKSDLGKGELEKGAVAATASVTPDGVVSVSAKTREGLDSLTQAILHVLGAGPAIRDVPAITNLRHLTLVGDAAHAVSHAREALASGATEELVLTDVTAARQRLEEITGRRSADDILHHIFSRFCVGK